jgi:hypothetical protein
MSWKVRSASPCSSAPTGPLGIRIECSVYSDAPKLACPLEILPEQIWCLIRHNWGRVNFVLWVLNHDAADVGNDCQTGCRFQMSRIRKGEFLFVHCDNDIKGVLLASCPVDQKQNIHAPQCHATVGRYSLTTRNQMTRHCLARIVMELQADMSPRNSSIGTYGTCWDAFLTGVSICTGRYRC